MIEPLQTEFELLNKSNFLLTMWCDEGLQFKEYTTTIGKVEVVYTQEFENSKLTNHYVELGINACYTKLTSITTGKDFVLLINLLRG